MRRVAGVVALAVLAPLTLVAALVGFGRIAYAVTTGVSMNPTYHAGDFVLVARQHTYSHGQVIAYQSGGRLVLHRIVGGDADGFVTRGDNNQSIDPASPNADEVVGRAVLHIPKIGAALRPPIARGLLAALALALVGGLMFSPRPKHATRSSAVTPGGLTLWKSLIALDALVLLALAASFALAPPRPPPVAARTQTASFGYRAATPLSDTYPTGEVVTGDPVFTRLVDAVDLTFGYTTDAPRASARGTARLDVALSTPSGWHTTLSVVPPTDLVAGAVDVSGTLDVARIQQLASSVATATGLDAGLVDVIVSASVDLSVDHAKPVTHTSRLPFKLTAFALTMSGPAPTASPKGAGFSTTTPIGHRPTAPDASAHARRQLRQGLLAALLLSVGTTVVLWPTTARPGHRPASELADAAVVSG
jgi:signal peptidase I